MIPTSKEKLDDRMMTKIQIPNKKLHQPFGRKQSESNILETTSKDVDFNKLQKTWYEWSYGKLFGKRSQRPSKDFNTEEEEEIESLKITFQTKITMKVGYHIKSEYENRVVIQE